MNAFRTVFLIINIFILCPIINCTSSITPSVEIPRKVSKRLATIKEKIAKKDLKTLSHFCLMIDQIEKGQNTVDQMVLHESLKELDKYCGRSQSNDPLDAQIISQYIEKIKKDLEDAPLITPTRCVPQACIGACAAQQDTCCLDNSPSSPVNPVCPSPSFLALSRLQGGAQGRLRQNEDLKAKRAEFSGQVSITDITESIDCGSGALTVNGGVGILGSLNVCGTEHIANVTPSTDCDNGALVVDGGIGIGQNLNVCGNLTVDGKVLFSNSTQSYDCDTGSLVIDGGIGIGKNANICGQVHIFDQTVSDSYNTGALIVDGGQGIGGDVNIAGQVHIFDFTDSYACKGGALVVDGGVGIGKNLYVCGDTTLAGSLLVEGGATIDEYLTVNGPLNVYGPVNTTYYFTINGSPVVSTNIANCNLSVGDNTNPVSNGVGNTAVGESALQNNQIGNRNTALGCRPLQYAIDGNDNTALGFQGTNNLLTGDRNTSVGSQALYNAVSKGYICRSFPKFIFEEVTVADATAIGFQALFDNQQAYNTAVGSQCFHDNICGYENTGIGYAAGQYNTFGSDNTAGGFLSACYNTIGYFNTSWGAHSLLYNQSFFNTAIGTDTLTYNIGGFQNTAVGAGSMGYNIIGIYNTAIGADSLTYNVIGSYNTAAGVGALTYNQSFYNTAIGNEAMIYNTIGAYNSTLGADTMEYVTAGFFNTALGFLSQEGNYATVFVPRYYNTSGGAFSLLENTGSYNTAFGGSTLPFAPLAYYNTAIGYYSLAFSPGDSIANTAIGAFSQAYLGDFNVIGGHYAYTQGVATVSIGAYAGVGAGTLGAIGIGYLSQTQGFDSIGIGSRAIIFGAGDVGIGGQAIVQGVGDVVIGQLAQGTGGQLISIGQLARAQALGSIGIGWNCLSSGAGAICVGQLSQALGVNSIAIGNGTKAIGANAIAIGAGAFAGGTQIIIGTPANVGTTHLYGLTPGINPLTVVSWTPGIGLLSYGPCPGCALSIPFSAEEDIFEEDYTIKRSTTEKLMALEIGSYRSNENSNDVSLGIFTQQVEEIFPELLVESPYEEKVKYLQINKLIIPLLQQIQEHHKILQDQQIQFTMQQEEIDRLREKCNELENIVFRLSELKNQEIN